MASASATPLGPPVKPEDDEFRAVSLSGSLHLLYSSIMTAGVGLEIPP